MTQLSDIKKAIVDFPQMPGLQQTLIAKLTNPESNFKEIATEIQYDPGMTANLLKLANSAFFGLAREITSVQFAVARLGIKQIFEMLVSMGVAPVLKDLLPGYELRKVELMQHSIFTAIAAEELAKELNIERSDVCFTTGLLHHIGKIVLDPFIQKEKDIFIKKLDESSQYFDLIEEEVLGINHAEVGSEIMEKWEFPKELVEAVRHQYHPEKAGKYQEFAVILNLAITIAFSCGIGSGIDGFSYKVSIGKINNFDLSTEQIENVASIALLKMEELEDLLANL